LSIAAGREFIARQAPEPQPNKNTKDEANKQKPNRITSAETAADSELQPKITTCPAAIPLLCVRLIRY